MKKNIKFLLNFFTIFCLSLNLNLVYAAGSSDSGNNYTNLYKEAKRSIECNDFIPSV